MSPNPTRRQVLASSSTLAVGLAGCSKRESSADETPPGALTNETPIATETPAPISPSRFDWTAEQVRSATESHPPSLRLTLTNVGDAPVRTSFGPTPPYSGMAVEAEDSKGELYLFHPDMGPSAPERRLDGCWQLYPETDVGFNLEATVRELSPGTSVRNMYDVYNMPTNDACFPAGTYRFRTHFWDESAELSLTVTITVADGGIEAVDASGPTET